MIITLRSKKKGMGVINMASFLFAKFTMRIMKGCVSMNKEQVKLLRNRLISISEGLIVAVNKEETSAKDQKILTENGRLLEVIKVLMEHEKTMKES